MSFDDYSTLYLEESTLQEQLDIFHYNLQHSEPQEISLDELLLTPIPTYFSAPVSPVSPGNEDIFIPTANNTIGKKRNARKALPPGQSTLSIRVSTHKTTRPPRHLECFNCKVTKTPLWRRSADRTKTLCNACGLYYKQYNQHRSVHTRNKPSSPVTIKYHSYPLLPSSPPAAQQTITPPLTPPSSSSSEEEESIIECHNCRQTNTPLWRKNENGDPLCNACGLYYKLHHKHRPVEMRKSTIQRRRRDWASTGQDQLIQQQKQQWIQEQPHKEQATAEEQEFTNYYLQQKSQGFLGVDRCDLLRTVLE